MTVTKARTFRNILYTALGKGLTLVCVALASLVVARNLTPSDYGVVGFAGIIIGFLAQFSDMGVGNAVVRSPELHQRDLDTAFTLKVVLGCGAFVLAFLIAPYAHHLFEHPATGNVIRILALNFLVSSIGFVPQVMLTREMNFRALVVPGVASAFVQCILTVALVLHGWSFWAVIAANVGATLASGIVLQLARKSAIRFRFDWAVAQGYLRFGIPLFGSGVVGFLIFNLDNFLVGASMGSAQLGYYALAFTWGSFICGLLSSTVHSALFPAFSAIQNDPVAVRRWYLKTVELVAFIAVVANAALFANAHFFLVTFLGKGTDKWLPAMLALRILCVYGIVRAVTEPLAPCLLARGQTKKILHANLLAGSLELAMLLFALRSGRIEVVASAVLIAYASQFMIYLPFLRREFSIGFGDILAKTWPIIPSFGTGWLITALLPSSFGSTFVTLGIRGLFTAVVVGLTHGLLSRFRCFHEAGQMISQNFAR
ncbi:MAG: lipopolysaccharide biosynthesis protein [Formivibrio sp.]|nr:lipopolysaccharide biosynthesis protein [Formivibrio sp.]